MVWISVGSGRRIKGRIMGGSKGRIMVLKQGNLGLNLFFDG